MQRSDVTRDDGTWVGLSLDVPDRHQPGLCIFSAGPRLLISQLSRPVLLAVVDENLQGADFWRTDEYHSQSFTLPRDGAHFIGDVPKIKGDGMSMPVCLFSHDPPETRASPLPVGRSVTV